MIFFYRFNGDHVEGTSCGSESKNDDVCLQIAFFLCFIYNRLPKPGRAWVVLCWQSLAEPGRAWTLLVGDEHLLRTLCICYKSLCATCLAELGLSVVGSK